ncbi:MAG: hypothetical protein KDB37_20225 [Ilumatobacter sp.]|nr:hypothetical protein [Ilumatobacter sp.]
MRTIAVDPGRGGAIALLHRDVLVAVVDMPIMPDRAIDVWTLARYVEDLIGDESLPTFVLEEPPFMPDQANQMTKGRDMGRVEATLARFTTTIIPARPPVWKRHHGLIKQPKDASRELALELWPAAEPLLARKGDVDRAEAALIGRWAWDTGLVE